ncbi:hypothetical protein BJ912DRAFT_939045 [Pholiota molesta]|nr:hypothetical protein BJ912DRAFT_939045 [Pholiota molesta]
MSHIRLSRQLCRLQDRVRSFAAISSNSPPPSLNTEGAKSRVVDYVRDEVAERCWKDFCTILDLGSGPGHFSKLLETGKLQNPSCLIPVRDPDSDFEVEVERIHADEENLLKSVESNSQEAVVSCLSLHWVNDLPGTLVQIQQSLKPDGLFLGAMFGGDTLFELRTSLQLRNLSVKAIDPDTRDISNLLGHEVKVAYPSMWELMETFKIWARETLRNTIHRDTLAAASAIYKELHGSEDGSVPATFQIIYMIGWKPAPTQPKPLERGSGKVNLKDVL